MKIVWYARGSGIAKCGPFSSQIEATNAMRLAPYEKRNPLTRDPAYKNQLFPIDVFVWPEEIEE